MGFLLSFKNIILRNVYHTECCGEVSLLSKLVGYTLGLTFLTLVDVLGCFCVSDAENLFPQFRLSLGISAVRVDINSYEATYPLLFSFKALISADEGVETRAPFQSLDVADTSSKAWVGILSISEPHHML